MPEIDSSDFDKRIVAFMGPEGSGKSTLAKKLACQIQRPYLSTGDIIRELSYSDPGKLGEACRVMFREKRYLDANILMEILTDRYRGEDMSRGFVVDGALRTVKETVDYPDFLKSVGRDFPMTVVHLRIPGWMSMDRIVYGANARKRDHRDTEEEVLTRLAEYHNQVGLRTAIISQTPNWNLVHVNAMGPLDCVYQRITSVLQ